MHKFPKLYYASLGVLSIIAAATVIDVRVCNATDRAPRSAALHKPHTVKHDQKNFTVVKKQQRMLLYLPTIRVVGCSSLQDARQIAKVFADVGTDPVRSDTAYEAFWSKNECRIYTDGISLEAKFAQASFPTKQHAMVKVFKAEEGEVEPKAFQGTIYIVMMTPEVLGNIFRCEHNVNEETGFDTIDLCRPNI